VRFARDVRKYFPFALYSAFADLKSQVQGSYLGWMWWVLDPLLFMLVYSFIVEVVFGTNMENFPLYVFIGLTSWNFFAATVQSSVGVIRSYRSVLQKSPIPKFILVVMTLIINLIKMGIGLMLSFFAAMVLGIFPNAGMLGIFPVMVVYIVLTFGASLIGAHIGVYIVDFNNVMVVLLRLLFYLSGVFFTLDRLPGKAKELYNFVCPTGFLLEQFRFALMYSQPLSYLVLGYWLAVGIGLSAFGLWLTYSHENTYMKVI